MSNESYIEFESLLPILEAIFKAESGTTPSLQEIDDKSIHSVSFVL